jgi:hypothetical protein
VGKTHFVTFAVLLRKKKKKNKKQVVKTIPPFFKENNLQMNDSFGVQKCISKQMHGDV